MFSIQVKKRTCGKCTSKGVGTSSLSAIASGSNMRMSWAETVKLQVHRLDAQNYYGNAQDNNFCINYKLRPRISVIGFFGLLVRRYVAGSVRRCVTL